MESLVITTGIRPKFCFEFKSYCLNIWTGELLKWPWIANDANDWPNDAECAKTTQNFQKRCKHEGPIPESPETFHLWYIWDFFDYKKSLVFKKFSLILSLKQSACRPTSHFSQAKSVLLYFLPLSEEWPVLPLAVGANNPVICAIQTNRFRNIGNSESILWGCTMFLHNASNQLTEEVQKWFIDSSYLHSEAPCIIQRETMKKMATTTTWFCTSPYTLLSLHLACRHYPWKYYRYLATQVGCGKVIIFFSVRLYRVVHDSLRSALWILLATYTPFQPTKITSSLKTTSQDPWLTVFFQTFLQSN